MSMSCGNRKSTDLMLAQKVAIIDLVSKMTQTELSQRSRCAQSTISKVLRQKGQLVKDAAGNMTSDRKRKRTRKTEDVEKALYTLFGDSQAQDAPISTFILEENTRQFSTTWISQTSRLLMVGNS